MEIQCPEDISVITDLNECSANVDNLNLKYSGGTLSSLTWKMTGATEDQSPTLGINQIESYGFEVGVTFVNYTAKDISGNTLGCSFTVVVIDNQVPEIAAPENITISCNGRIPTAYATLQAFLNAGGTASDNCSVRASSFRLVSEEKDKMYCPYTITRNYQASDYSGNSSTVTHLIFVGSEESETIESNAENHTSLKSGMASFTAVQSGNWNDPNTWGGSIPGLNDDVTIPSGITVTVNAASVCNDINILSGGTVNYSGTQTLRVYGNWNNYGTFNAGTSGTVEFTGSSNTTINGNTTFEELIINKTDINTTLTINGTNSVSGGGSILLTGGLITIPTGGSFSINPSSGITINSTAGFDVTGGTLNTGNFSITNKGLIRISAGTANFGSGSGNEIHTQFDGAFIVNGGNVNISGRLYNSASGTLAPPGVTSGISILGGIVTLATVGNGLSSVGSLNVTPAGNFNFAGGTIVFQNPSTASTELDLGLTAGGGTKNTVGGTFQFGNGSTSPGSVFNISSSVLINRITSTANADLQLSSDIQVNQLALNSSSTLNLNGNSLQISATGPGTYTFPVDDGSGNSIPVTVTLNPGTGPFGSNPYVEVTTTDVKHSNNASSTNFLSRYWTITLNDISNPNYNVTVEYPSGDISGNESGIAAGVWDGSLPWTKYNTINTGANTISATGVTSTNIDITGITLTPPTVEINNGNVSETICFGSSVTLNAVASGDPSLSYSWASSPSGFSSASSSININPSVITIYTVTVTDGNGFTASDDIQVTVNPTPTVNVVSDQVVCAGSNTTAINFSGTATSFNWTNTNYAIGLAASGNGNIPSFTATNSTSSPIFGTIEVTPIYTSGGTTCTGTPTTFEITVNPTPTVNVVSDQVVCAGSNTTAINFSGTATSFNWTNTNSAIGLAASGNGNIGSFTATNSTNSPIFCTIEVTPIYTSGGTTCTGTPTTFEITVNPTPTLNVVSDQVVCAGSNTTAINFSGTATSFNWTNTNSAIGLAASGNGNIGSFTATNSTNSPIFCTIEVTPIYTSGGTTCTGTPTTFEITVNPTPTVNVVSDQVVCAGSNTTAINFSGTATSFNWTNTNSAIGLAASGSGNIPSFTATNSTNSPISGTIEVTPIYNNGGVICNGVVETFVISVTPPISATATVIDQILCYGGTANIQITASGGTPPYSYNFQGETSNSTGIFTGITGTVTGTNYNWSVTDANGCAAYTGTITVTQPEELTANATIPTP